MTDFLLLAFVFLVAGVFSVPIATRLGLGSVLGYLVAGILISPVLGLLQVDVLSIQHFAEFGVVMMLFLVGLELEPKLLWQMRAKLLGLGGAQVAGSTLIVMLVAFALGQPWTVSLAIGLVLSLSSTAIVLQTLNEKGLMKSDGGQSSFSVLLFQDIAVIPMLALIPLLALPELVEVQHAVTESHGTEDAGHGMTLSLVAGLNGWQTTLVTLAAVALVIAAGNYLTRPLFRFIAGSQLRELFTATALLMVIGIALLMSLVGLSPALGTFLAGMVLANSEYRHELESDIDPFKGLLLGLFFMSVGAGINFALLADNLAVIVALTLGLIAAKAAVLYVLAIVFKLRGADRWLFALGLAQAGEFGFVLLSFTVANSVIPAAVADQLLLVVALSMLLTPALFIFYDRVVAPKFVETAGREADTFDEENRIIIAGHGRVGGLLRRMLSSAGYMSTVIDFNSKRIDMMGRFGLKTYYGDATRPDLLHAAGVANAKLFIVAIDDRDQITELTKYLIKTYPDLHVQARALDRDHVYDLYLAGCRDIVRETYDSTIRMGRSAFEALGIKTPNARAMADAFDRMDRKAMIEVASSYNPDIPLSENDAYIKKVNEVMGSWRDELEREMEEIRRAD
ncbi:Kef-type potassium/proton antiporter, CPA2 family [Hoeflea sp. IMCC20628]|uniref:monovalent cation:proton antiporter-2 (CPA2) family protein n=1 Tax=Hoeflea sp. IMCC20628 TaxID=1620421 RepID=UPI00063ABD66|nr:monovalent cation:proton antiporter-2 (CPA2) family protein [Hoeflea sp. IMCC20628]AKI02937.1 Kef-type potassium/proton antiporter, CPA2 family [Hoeflea sp. IMCC20628]